MELQWRPGANHQVPDAFPRLPVGDAPGADVNDSFPDDSSTRTTYSGPKGPVLEGVLLSELGADEVDTPAGKNAMEVASVIVTSGGAEAVDGSAERAADTGGSVLHRQHSEGQARSPPRLWRW